MKTTGFKRLMVVSSCGLVLSGTPVAMAEELVAASQEQTTTEDTAIQEPEVLEQEQPAPEQEEIKAEVVNEAPVKKTLPVLNGVKNHTIKEGETFDPKAGVTAQDEQDGDLTDQIQLTGSVDTNQAGTYTVTYSVKNLLGESATATAIIQVEKIEKQAAPLPQPQAYTLEIADFTALRYSDLKAQMIERLVLKESNGAIATLADVSSFTIDQPEATNTLGEKTITLSVTASDGTVSEKTITVTVVSGLRIETTDLTLIDEETFDPYAGIQAFETASDGSETRLGAYDPATKTGIEVIKNTVDLNKAGLYEVRYRVHTSLGETAERSIRVTVIVKQIFDPTIYLTVNDQIMTVGEELTSEKILGWAEVLGASHIAYEIVDQVIPVDAYNRLTSAGSYRIRYTATKEGVPSVQKEIILTVRDRVCYSAPTVQKRILRTSPQLGSVRTERKLPKTGETKSSLLNPLLGLSLIGLVAFLKRERLLSKLMGKK